MEEAFKVWDTSKNPENMGKLLDAAEPVIQSALQSYAGGNKSLRGRARLLAASAFQTFDPTKGAKLRTHLMTQLQPLNRYNKAFQQVTHVPERVSADLYKINQEHQKFFDQYGKEPTDRELADVTGLSSRRIAKVRGFARGEMAESSLTEMDEGEKSVMYPGVSKVDPKQVWLEYVHHDLAPTDQKILEWRTGYNGKMVLSNNEIAKRLGLSPGAVSQRAAKIAERIAQGAGEIG